MDVASAELTGLLFYARVEGAIGKREHCKGKFSSSEQLHFSHIPCFQKRNLQLHRQEKTNTVGAVDEVVNGIMLKCGLPFAANHPAASIKICDLVSGNKKLQLLYHFSRKQLVCYFGEFWAVRNSHS